jgi:chitin disaccharide deacetylase
LIVNADDFGLTPGVNAGVLDTHTRGILTSASLIANAPATEDAIAIARRTPTLAVGCHLTLVDGCPVLPPAEVPTLAPDGRFRPTWTSFVRDLAMRRIRRREMELELTAQVRRIIDAGLPLTHLDSHKHVHTHPSVFGIVARIAMRFGIRTVRVPFERPAVRLLCRHALGIGSRQALENLALGPWAARDRRMLIRHGLAAPPHFFGRVLTGLFTAPSLQALLRSVPEGTSELMMHPGYPDADLDRVRTRLRGQRAHEVALLTDRSTLELVKDAEIRLTRPDGIVAERRS